MHALRYQQGVGQCSFTTNSPADLVEGPAKCVRSDEWLRAGLTKLPALTVYVQKVP